MAKIGLSRLLVVSVVAVAFTTTQVNGGGRMKDHKKHIETGSGVHLSGGGMKDDVEISDGQPDQGKESGGKTEIKDAKTNKEIQAMGRYCVSEYNKALTAKNQESELLDFKEVVSAEKQVVAGFKYFLHIAATAPSGATKTFDAQLLIKPRARDMEMMVFEPTFTPAVDATPAAASTPTAAN